MAASGAMAVQEGADDGCQQRTHLVAQEGAGDGGQQRDVGARPRVRQRLRLGERGLGFRFVSNGCGLIHESQTLEGEAKIW